MARASRSSCGYLVSLYVVALFAWATGLVSLMHPLWHRMAEMPVTCAYTKTKESSIGSKCRSRVSSFRSFFNVSNSSWQSLSHMNLALFFVRFRRWLVLVKKFGMKSLRLWIMHRNERTSFLSVGGVSCFRAFTLAGSGFIPSSAPPGYLCFPFDAFVQV